MRSTIVAMFFHRYRWGIQVRGDERGFFEKAKEYNKMGVDLRAFEKSPSFQDDVHEEAYRSLQVSGCKIPARNPFELFLLVVNVLGTAFGRIPVHPRAIYSYNQDVENVFPGFVLKILTGAPLVVIHHQIDQSSVQPFGSSFASKRSAGYGLMSALWRSFPPWINKFAMLRADTHIALSEAAKLDVEKVVGITNCVVVGNGLDTEKFHPLPLPKVYDAAFFGRLAPQKGIDILLRAWKDVVHTIPRAKLVLIGGGDEVNFRKYRGMISELSLQDNVIITGFQSDQKVVELLNSSKLFVLPSRKEGFAQSVSQAMACGMCCVLSDIPALREYYGDAAVLVPSENSDILSSTIIQLLSDEKRQAEMRKNSRQQVIGFSWQSTVKSELKEISKSKKS